MNLKKKHINTKQGFALVASMIFLCVFAALSVALISVSTRNVQIANNQHKHNCALAAAMSGIEYGKMKTSQFGSQTKVTTKPNSEQKSQAWKDFRSFMLEHPCNGHCHHCRNGYSKNGKTMDDFSLDIINYGSNENFGFELKFIQDVNDPNIIIMQSTGTDGTYKKTISIEMTVDRDNSVLKYAIASKGRIWITSNTTIGGDIYSTWDATRYGSAAVETANCVVNDGDIYVSNTIDELDGENVQMEVIDANDDPTDSTVQGQYDDIIYDHDDSDMPGLDEDDYDTSIYRDMCGTTIPTSGEIVREYFPHQEGNYNSSKSGSLEFNRHIYRNQTFTDAILPKGRNALFENCTFDGVFFVESQSNTSTTSKTNNVRFENCQFNGVIVSDVPKNSSIKWRENCLYFTGGAMFDNQWSQQEATILAPNFNVNLGNTTELEYDRQSELNGAIVGGIVDVRGIVDVNGTIISMYDTRSHSSGYVTNIGSTDDDGGTEGGAFAGENIRIVPSQEQLLPDGINTKIVIRPIAGTYREQELY